MKTFILSCMLLITSLSWGQQTEFHRIVQIRTTLESMVADIPALNESVATVVKNGSLAEFVRGLGYEYGLNISVDQKLEEMTVTHSFADAEILDVLVLLCKEHKLTIDVTGGIISVSKYDPPPKEEVRVIRQPGVEYNKSNDFLSLDLKKDTLSVVAERITANSSHNLILGEGIEDKKVSCYIQNRPFEEVLSKMAFANGLELTTDGEFFILKELPKEAKNPRNQKQDEEAADPEIAPDDILVSIEKGLITVKADNQKISDIIQEVSTETLNSYFIYSNPEETISLFIENATFEEFLTYILKGTSESFVKQGRVYLIGSDKEGDLRTTELIQLKNRTIDNILTSSGNRGFNRSNQGGGNNQNGNNQNGGLNQGNRNSSLSGNSFNSKLFTQDLDVQPFPELNSFIVTGSYSEVESFKGFIEKIDQVVPVIVIDVIIVDVNKNRTLSAGVQAGIGQAPNQSSGQILGGSDNNGANVQLSTDDINSLINSFNGLGLVNLGNVTPNFYLNLQALETDGVLRSKDNVKLATLNSFPAQVNAGSQEYYLETTTNVSASATNNLVIEQQNWIPLDANLTVQIIPIVSGDEQVTLEILVSQSSFTERAGGDNGPFGTVTRDFSSNIRVKNGDMILLGGLEDKTVSNSGGGLPFLSRVPILKWIFGNRTKTKSKSQLNIFIKTTVLY